MFRILGEADSGIHDYPGRFHPRAPGGGGLVLQEGTDFRDHVAIARHPVHCLRCTPHVHDHQRGAGF
jgi:hypothetical protein